MLTLHIDSHIDHGLTERQIAHILKVFVEKNEFFIDTIEIPKHLGTVPCMLWGPIMGDDPIPDDPIPYKVEMRRRGNRPYLSRVLVGFKPHTSNQVTVIAGPHAGEACALYTAFGGPLAPKEPGELAATIADFIAEHCVQDMPQDKRNALVKLKQDYIESKKFWAEHALCL